MTDQFTTFLSVFNLNWHFYIKLGYYIPLSKLRFANFWFATVRYRAFQSGYFCWPLPIARKHLLRYTTVLLPDHRSQLYSQSGVVFVCICIAVKESGLVWESPLKICHVAPFLITYTLHEAGLWCSTFHFMPLVQRIVWRDSYVKSW